VAGRGLHLLLVRDHDLCRERSRSRLHASRKECVALHLEGRRRDVVLRRRRRGRGPRVANQSRPLRSEDRRRVAAGAFGADRFRQEQNRSSAPVARRHGQGPLLHARHGGVTKHELLLFDGLDWQHGVRRLRRPRRS